MVDLTSPCVPYAGIDAGICVPPGMIADEGYWLSHSSAYFITNLDGHYPGFPVLKRTYNALEVTAEKRMSDNWQLLASYRYARLTGNYEGLFRRDNGQSNPHLTSIADFAACLANPDGTCTKSEYIGNTFDEGPLPNDQRHMIKLYGTYRWNMGLTAGAGLNFNTGNPMQKLGAIPIYGSNERLLTPRGALGRTNSLTTVDVHADYALTTGPGRVILGLDVFNLLNSRKPINYDLASQIDDETHDPPDSRDYLKVNEYQDPRLVRFLVKYAF